MDIFNGYNDWNWRFGETPDFKNSLEHKFSWALNDCLSEGRTTYDQSGVKKMCQTVGEQFKNDKVILDYLAELE